MVSSEPSVLTRTAAGAGWLIAWRVCHRVFGLTSTLVLLRLLTPADFGLVTLAFSFTAAAESFAALGVEVQLIRSRDLRPALYDTAFTINLLRGLLIAGVVATGSGPVAAWFNEPRLSEVMLALALHSLFMGCINIRLVAFQRELRFSRVFLAQFVPRLAQFVVGIVLAVVLRSYWALIAAILTWSATMLVFGYLLIPVRPRLTLVAWRELLSVSVWIWLTNVAFVFRDRTEMFMIGRVFGVIKAGIYAVALEFASLPMSEVVGQIAGATMPGLAAGMRAHGDGHTALVFRRIFAIAIMLSASMGVGVSLVSGPFAALVLGPRWAETAPLMMIIGILIVPMGPGLVAGALLTARGQMQLLFAITSAAALLRASLVTAVTSRHGLAEVAAGMGSIVIIEAAALIASASRSVGMTLSGVAAATWRPLLSTLLMIGVLHWAGLAWLPPPARAGEAAVLLVSAAALGAAVFAAASALLWLAAGRPAAAELDLLLLLQRSLAGLTARVLRR